MVSVENVLKTISPNASPAFIKASANAGAIMAEFKITSVNAQAQLLGQMAVECGGFRTFAENLNYSATRLTQVWPNRFPSIAAATPFAKNPRALANKVYNGRMGNRPNSDDGWNYRGSGGLQHTGMTEFDRVKRRTGLDVVGSPDWLRNPAQGDVMWRAACSYFVDRGALEAANNGQTETVTVKVNGGRNGLADRKIMVQRASLALMGHVLVVTEPTSHEDADDAKKKATQATITAPAAGGGAGGATKAGDKSTFGTSSAILVGVLVFVVVAGVAFAYWRKHFSTVATIEATQMKAVDDRIAAAAVAAGEGSTNG